MVTLGKRVKTTPIIIDHDMKPQKLNRLPVNVKLFQEEWMQNLIRDYPSLLPLDEIEPVFGPCVNIGVEIPTKDGNIDNLFISPQGYLTIVETKLWRNPEARREVVGQIIDYAKEINKWTYDELNSKVKEYFKNSYGLNNKGIIDALREIDDIEEEQEQEIIDSITKQIKRGRLLLLIVGDGIRESVETLAEFLAQTPHLHFTLALVELQIFEMDDKRLVIPQVVFRTREITRAVVRVEGGTMQNISIGIDIQEESKSINKKRRTLSEEDFFAELSKNVEQDGVDFAQKILEDAQRLGCEIEWKHASFVIKMRDPLGSGQLLTLLVISTDGEIYYGWLPDQLERVGLSKIVGIRYFDELNEKLTGCESNPLKHGVWNLQKTKSRYEELKALIAKVIDQIRKSADEQER